jgi:hypothetical protein
VMLTYGDARLASAERGAERLARAAAPGQRR